MTDGNLGAQLRCETEPVPSYSRCVPRWQRIFVIACACVIGYSLAYTLSDFGQWPKLTYFPYEGEWAWFRVPPGPVPMPYVGMVFWGVVGGAGCAVVAAGSCHVRKTPISDTMLRLWGGWSLSAFAFAGLYFTWNLWPF